MAKSIFSSEHKILVSKLVQARKELGLLQEEVAEKLGRTQSYVSKIESGQRRLDIVQLKEFAKIYKKKVEHFLK